MKNMRKSRIFQRDAYISIDFLGKETEIVRMKSIEGEVDPLSLTIDLGDGKGHKEIYFDKPEIIPNNAIKDELQSFYDAIVNNTTPSVSIEDGYNALSVAHEVLGKMNM